MDEKNDERGEKEVKNDKEREEEKRKIWKKKNDLDTATLGTI